MIRTFPRVLCLAALCASGYFPGSLRADDTRVPVAVVNGLPVFHSELFKSQKVKDDVDRAVILQAYEKSENILAPELVSTALQNIVKESYAGDAAKLTADLQRHHATPEDYVRYLAEELVLAAMFDQHKDDPAGTWIADLRKQASVEKWKPGDKLPDPTPGPGVVPALPAPSTGPFPNSPARRAPDPRRKPDPSPSPSPAPPTPGAPR